jgi:hypothetical protein
MESMPPGFISLTLIAVALDMTTLYSGKSED